MKSVTLNLRKNDYQIEEAFKALRTNIQFCGERVKVIDITSCTPDEGKSSVSLRLAKSLAESGKRTLYLDADMRKSTLAGKIDAGGEEIYGLSYVLSGQTGLEECLLKTQYPNLYLIAAGKFPPNPAELLDSRVFISLIDALRGAFDYVLIDTPPLANVIDSAIVARECDGAVLVIEAGTVGYRFAQDILAQLDRSACPVLGAVLNKVDMKRTGKYYGKY